MNQASPISLFKAALIEWLVKNSFWILVIIAILCAAVVKGIAFGGMFMGMMATIAIWALVLKLPTGMKAWMGKHILLSDLLLTIFSSALLGYIGSGPTVFMAAATVAVLMTVLLMGLNLKYKNYDKRAPVEEPEHTT